MFYESCFIEGNVDFFLHVNAILLTHCFVETPEIEDKSKVIPSKLSPRQQVVMELLQTEKNYVGILHTILNVRILNVICTCTVHAIYE